MKVQHSFWRFQGRICSRLPKSAYIPWLVVPSSTFKASNVASSPLSDFLPPSCKAPCGDPGTTRINEDNLSISISLIQSHLFYKVTHALVLGIRMETFLGGHYSVYPKYLEVKHIFLLLMWAALLRIINRTLMQIRLYA